MTLVMLIGPPAVGKMAVGRELARTGAFGLFHNHHTIEPLAEIFGHGTPAFDTLNSEWRTRVIEEAARHGHSLVFTFVWDLASKDERDWVTQLVAPYEDAGGEVVVVELAADLSTRLRRNRTEERLASKPSKRDLDWSHANVLEMESFTMNTHPGSRLPAHDFLDAHRYLRIDTTALTAGETAAHIGAWLDLPSVGGAA